MDEIKMKNGVVLVLFESNHGKMKSIYDDKESADIAQQFFSLLMDNKRRREQAQWN